MHVDVPQTLARYECKVKVFLYLTLRFDTDFFSVVLRAEIVNAAAQYLPSNNNSGA